MSDSMKWMLLGALSLVFSILVLGNTVIEQWLSPP